MNRNGNGKFVKPQKRMVVWFLRAMNKKLRLKSLFGCRVTGGDRLAERERQTKSPFEQEIRESEWDCGNREANSAQSYNTIRIRRNNACEWGNGLVGWG